MLAELSDQPEQRGSSNDVDDAQLLHALQASAPDGLPTDKGELINVVAKAFARLLLEDAGEFRTREPQTYTEFAARRVSEQPYYKRTREHDPARDGDDQVERDLALSDFAQDVNESESFNGREHFTNALDPEAILDQLVAAVRERRGE